MLSRNLFGKRGQRHSHFVLTDANSGKRLDRGVEVHTLELLKYKLKKRDIHRASEIEKWVCFLLHARECDSEEVRIMLPDDEFSQPSMS